MNFLARYKVQVQGYSDCLGTLQVREVANRAEACAQAISKLGAALPHLNQKTVKGLKIELEDVPETPPAAVQPEFLPLRGCSCLAWLAVLPWLLDWVAAHTVLAVAIFSLLAVAVSVGLAWAVDRSLGWRGGDE